MRSKLAIVLVALAGCEPAPAPPRASFPPPDIATVEPEPTPLVERCPIVPLALVVSSTNPPTTLMTLDASGAVTIALSRKWTPTASISNRGCLRGADGVWAELAPDGSVWTLRTPYTIDDEWLVADGGRAWRVAPGGEVMVREKLGGSEYAGELRFDGFQGSARCVANLMLVTFMGMTASMAVSDGHPRELPPPEGSLCR